MALFTGLVVYWTKFIFGSSLSVSVPGLGYLRFSGDGRECSFENKMSLSLGTLLPSGYRQQHRLYHLPRVWDD